MDIVVGPIGGTEILRRQNLFPDPFKTVKWDGPKVGSRVKFARRKGRLTPIRDRAVGITASGGIGGYAGAQ